MSMDWGSVISLLAVVLSSIAYGHRVGYREGRESAINDIGKGRFIPEGFFLIRTSTAQSQPDSTVHISHSGNIHPSK